MLPYPSQKHLGHIEDSNIHTMWLQKEEQSTLAQIFLRLPEPRRPAASRSPEPLTGQASGMVPRPQQRPGSQQHCIFVILPGSSCAQRPFTRPEKHVPVLWSERVKIKQKAWQNYLRLLHQSSHTLEEANGSDLFYLVSGASIYSLRIYPIYSFFTYLLNTHSLSTCSVPHPRDTDVKAVCALWAHTAVRSQPSQVWSSKERHDPVSS